MITAFPDIVDIAFTADMEDKLDAVEAGAREAGTNYTRVTDRTEAIHAALDMAGAGDTVLICGKGHETYQVLQNGIIHLDEREVVAEALGMKNKWELSLYSRNGIRRK